MTTIIAQVPVNVRLYRKKRQAFGSGTTCLIFGVVCFVVRKVKLDNDYGYYQSEYTGWLVAGIIFIICAVIMFIYGLILQCRISDSSQPGCVVVTSEPAPPVCTPFVPGTTYPSNLSAPSGNYQPGYNQYPQGAYPGQGAYPQAPYPDQGTYPGQRAYPQAANPGQGAYPGSQGNYPGPVEPPPPYYDQRRY